MGIPFGRIYLIGYPLIHIQAEGEPFASKLITLRHSTENMYHPSIFHRVPRNLGVYVLRRNLKPYITGTGTDTVNRTSVVGYSGDVRQTLTQYFCEHTRTAMTPNYRNTAMALREQVTHIDCYFHSHLMIDEVNAMAVERILSEELEPMLRPPRDRDNIANSSVSISKGQGFRESVLEIISNPTLTVRLPNRDNILSDLIDLITNLQLDDNTDYNQLTVAQIKEILRERDLAVSGRKSELIARLRNRRYGVQK